MTWFSRVATPRFSWLRRWFNARSALTILDVGCANGSPSKTKLLFPHCTYAAIDIVPLDSLAPEDVDAIDSYWQMDLEDPDFSGIPDCSFDAILLAHVIEHVRNGEEVLSGLAPKLRDGGLMYIEFPSARSLRLPHMAATLNFYDDPTHVRLYAADELADFATSIGLRVLAAGTRRSWLRLCATPVMALRDLARHRRLRGPAFWDLTGFAEYVVATPAATPFEGSRMN